MASVAAPQGIALVHDYLLAPRGAERTFAAMADCWPDAPIFTLLHDSRAMSGLFGGRDVHASHLQRLPASQANFRYLLPLFPSAVERLPMADYELVLSSSSAFAHGVKPGAGSLHISYCHSPFRYVWHERSRALTEAPRYLRALTRRDLERVRRWDLKASQRVDRYIANSELTRARIQQFWGRDAEVVHPPVDVDRFHTGAPGDYFLVVGEVVSHKRTEVALEAARRAGKPLKVVGTGPALSFLRRKYGAGAEFLGRVSDSELVELYAHARALVVPNVEEFGIAAVEAQAAGRPVLALDAGGARETVIDGETGVLVGSEAPDAFAEAMTYVDFEKFDPERLARHARSFSTARFQERLQTEVARICSSTKETLSEALV